MTDSEKNKKITRKLFEKFPSLKKLFGGSFTPEQEAKLFKGLEEAPPSASESAAKSQVEQKKEKPHDGV